ncbi:MAG TPA: class I SAM-dependent methyltransferase [Papillibacter sp.]|jgi:SAM-dependent methyltransferase|nr:class I SAM-dependent methyltransferase [Papillibacter sp.]
MERKNIYESEPFLTLPDTSMHPGGLRLTARAARLAGIKEGMTVADIGCGTGASAAFLQRTLGVRAIGLDLSNELIARGLKENPGLRLLHWDCKSLPFEDGSLDAAFCECTLSVIGGHASLFQELARALSPGGILVISEVCLAPNAQYSGLHREEELVFLLQKAGFTVTHREDHTNALKTFAAELSLRGMDQGALGALLCSSCFGAPPGKKTPGLRLRDLKYALIIAEKPH